MQGRETQGRRPAARGSEHRSLGNAEKIDEGERKPRTSCSGRPPAQTSAEIAGAIRSDQAKARVEQGSLQWEHSLTPARRPVKVDNRRTLSGLSIFKWPTIGLDRLALAHRKVG
jgi:hypothetical protein